MNHSGWRFYLVVLAIVGLIFGPLLYFNCTIAWAISTHAISHAATCQSVVACQADD